MNLYKKILTRPYLRAASIFLAMGFGIYYYNLDPLDISLDSPEHKLKNFVIPNKPLVISFWASWCQHCKHEAQILKQLKQQHPEISVIGLQVDNGIPGSAFENTGYPNLNAHKHSTEIMQLFGNYTDAVPFTVIIKNKHSKTLLGSTSSEELYQTILKP